MTDRHLGSLQVAALLVSASYGIGFLFGSGELALTHGMAGSLYGVATAIGMLALAAFAHRLWATGVPLWELFGRSYGRRVQDAVALLSLVWMAGVLAAQIHGGAAVIQLLGLDGWPGFLVALMSIFLASRLDLRFASVVFAGCLLASALVLACALVMTGGVGLYARSVPTFLDDLSTYSPARLLAMTLAISLLVCSGADYHQFVLAARRPSAAVLGCLLAALGLILIGFLPAAVVVTMRDAGVLGELVEPKQVVPQLLSHVAATIGPGAGKAMLIALSAAALGSGAAILRAMASALASATPGPQGAAHAGHALMALALGAAVATRGQGIVDTMVSVNVVYLASVTVCFVALLRGTPMTPRQATTIMAAGFLSSLAVYLAGWAGWLTGDADSVSLACGLGASLVAAAMLALGAATRSCSISGGRR